MVEWLVYVFCWTVLQNSVMVWIDEDKFTGLFRLLFGTVFGKKDVSRKSLGLFKAS